MDGIDTNRATTEFERGELEAKKPREHEGGPWAAFPTPALSPG
jgi:hypothetical protein